MRGKAEKYLRYDASDHSFDHHHCDVIVKRVTSEFGDVDGCLTLWEFYVPLTALVCTRLGKPGIPHSGVFAAMSKSLTMTALLQSVDQTGERGPFRKYASSCYPVKSAADVKSLEGTVHFPTILKIDFGAEAVVTKLVDSVQEACEHVQEVQRLRREQADPAVSEQLTLTPESDTEQDATGPTSDSERKVLVSTSFHVDKSTFRSLGYYLGGGFSQSCILTEFLEGSEHCVDLAIFHGELVCAFVCDKGPQIPPDVFKTVLTMPSLLPDDKLASVVTAAFQCCRALGLGHGVFDVDVMLTSSGPKLIEINPRMGGYCQREFILQCYNVDLVHLAFMVACDVRPDVAVLSSMNPGFGSIANDAAGSSLCQGTYNKNTATSWAEKPSTDLPTMTTSIQSANGITSCISSKKIIGERFLGSSKGDPNDTRESLPGNKFRGHNVIPSTGIQNANAHFSKIASPFDFSTNESTVSQIANIIGGLQVQDTDEASVNTAVEGKTNMSPDKDILGLCTTAILITTTTATTSCMFNPLAHTGTGTVNRTGTCIHNGVRNSESILFSTPPASCHIVGMYCHPFRHAKAMKTTARPEILQDLHDKGQILYFRHEMKLRERPHEIPFCTLAVKAESFCLAKRGLLEACRRLGLDFGATPVENLLDYFTSKGNEKHGGKGDSQ